MKQRECFPLLLQDKHPIETFTFDGCHYYFLFSHCKKIIKTNLEFEEIQSYQLSKEYSCLCYDWSECNFWAYTPKSPHCLYKLNCKFEEVSTLPLNPNCIGNCQIMSLSYNCCHKQLCISTTRRIIEIQKDTGTCLNSYHPQVGAITSTYAFPPFYLILAYQCKVQSLYALTELGHLWKLCSFEQDQEIKGLIFKPSTKQCPTSYLQLLILEQSCTYRICSYSLSQIPSIQEPCPCNYKLHCCKQPPHPPTPPGNPYCNIIESIALEEAAISHILNAEGEKLQKVLATTSDINTILCVNREVNETIVNVTTLEQVLYSKLLAANKCCSDESDSCHTLPHPAE